MHVNYIHENQVESEREENRNYMLDIAIVEHKSIENQNKKWLIQYHLHDSKGHWRGKAFRKIMVCVVRSFWDTKGFFVT